MSQVEALPDSIVDGIIAATVENRKALTGTSTIREGSKRERVTGWKPS
jgi:hypothetical protein